MAQRKNMKGKKLKKFNFLQEIGSGQYGTVYKAINTKNEQMVAIKVISKSHMKQIPKLQKLVASQIAILKEVQSQNVIKFVDSFSSDQSVFIATQFCNGGDLQNYCQKKGKLNENQALNFLKQMLNGFKGLHQINTMHRDFKLANVLLHNNVCKIADLGFAKQIQDKSLTKTTLGTDDTMAPQVHEGKPYDWGADVWSLGVVFYSMLYGQVPFRGGNDYQILRKIKTTKPEYSGIDISEQCVDFIQKCLVADPTRRISWKQIYNHPLINRSQILLTTGLLRSKISFDSNKNYYQQNQQQKRKTYMQVLSNEPSQIKGVTQNTQMFENAGEVQNADHKAEKMRRNKQQLEAKFAQYEIYLIHSRNNKMFGISQVLGMERYLRSVEVQHFRALYEICKNSFIQIRDLRNQLEGKSFAGFTQWKQFKEQEIFGTIKAKLFQDELLAQALALSFRHDIQSQPQIKQQNMNRRTQLNSYRKVLGDYRTRLTPHLQIQQKKNKLKYIKMLRALRQIQDNIQIDFQRFNREIDNIDAREQQQHLLGNR